MQKLPRWLEDTARSLAFWIGYSRSRYGAHLLTEGAIVGEVTPLIAAQVGGESRVRAEVPYRLLGRKEGLDRADLVVFASATSHQALRHADVSSVIEVKRIESGKQLIERDVDRLHACLSGLPPRARAFLLLISQRHRPTKYVNANGTAVRGTRRTTGGSPYRVRRVVRARVGPRARGHYMCVLEVEKSRRGED